MYTATMLYQFKDDSFEAACEIWKGQVMELAKSQPGFIRMQFLTARPQALAIGTWAQNADARRFMETGVFKRLMTQLQDHVAAQPQQTIWDLRYFAENK
jgi:heme-degrading monooxygenase HmoA